MRIREWQDLLADVGEHRGDPSDWRAVGGTRARGVGEDLYIGHPDAGLYQLKTYAKNPYDVRGVGARVARSLDDEIGAFLPENESSGRFAVNAPRDEDETDREDRARRLAETVKAHADAPTTRGDLFDDVMEALDSPAFGPMEFGSTDRPDTLDGLTDTFEEAEELLDAELDDLIDADEVGRGFQ